MATQIKIEFISDGFKQILNSPGVQAAVLAEAEKIAAKANANITGESSGFEAHAWQGNYGGGRWIASASTTDYASMRAESEDKALTRAVGR